MAAPQEMLAKYEAYFWRHVRRVADSECWLWTGSTGHFGYGRIRARVGEGRQREMGAHRFSLWLHVGKHLPDSLFVCHSCDTPACVNPNHLRLGTQRDNIRDALERDRLKHGEENGNAKITEAIARAIWADEGAATEISRRHGVSSSIVRDIKRGRTWFRVTGAQAFRRAA